MGDNNFFIKLKLNKFTNYFRQDQRIKDKKSYFSKKKEND